MRSMRRDAQAEVTSSSADRVTATIQSNAEARLQGRVESATQRAFNGRRGPRLWGRELPMSLKTLRSDRA